MVRSVSPQSVPSWVQQSEQKIFAQCLIWTWSLTKYLIVLHARNLKSVLLSTVKVLAGLFPSKFSEEESVSFHSVVSGSHLDSMAQDSFLNHSNILLPPPWLPPLTESNIFLTLSYKVQKFNAQESQLNRAGRKGGALLTCGHHRGQREDEISPFFPGQDAVNRKLRALCLLSPSQFPYLLYESIFFPCPVETCIWLLIVADLEHLFPVPVILFLSCLFLCFALFLYMI